MKRAIHFTTINKFVRRIKQTWLEVFIARRVVSNEVSLVAIDGTGFSLQHRSPYFCTIAEERNRFMQTVAAEVKKRLIVAVRLRRKKRLIVAVRLRRKKRHETIDVPYLMKQANKQLTLSAFLADKGFDSEKNHLLAKKYRAEFIAPLKLKTNQYHRIRGIHRKRLFRNFPKEIYNQRAIIESIFSAIKRRFGHAIYAKKFNTQKKELLFRIISYNAEKLVNFCVIKFYFLKSQ